MRVTVTTYANASVENHYILLRVHYACANAKQAAFLCSRQTYICHAKLRSVYPCNHKKLCLGTQMHLGENYLYCSSIIIFIIKLATGTASTITLYLCSCSIVNS